MRALKANILKRDRVLLSAGGLSLAPVCFFAFFSLNIASPVILAVSGILAMLSAMALLPLIYDRIQNTVAVAVGRYHLTLAITTLLGAMFTVVAASARVWFSDVFASIAVIISIPATIVCFLAFYSVMISIRTRLTDNRDIQHAVLSGVFAVIAAAAVALFYIFAGEYGSLAPYAIAGQVAGILFLVGGTTVYFSSVAYMPRFIRLEEPTVRTLKEKYQTFLLPFSKKKAAMNAATHFFQTAAVCTACLFAGLAMADGWQSIFVFGAFLAGFAVSAVVGTKAVFQKNVDALSLVAAIFLICSAAGILTSFLFVDGENAMRLLLLIVCVALMGAGGGLQRAIVQYRIQEVVLSTTTTAGMFGNFYNLLTVCAFAVSTLFCMGGAYVMLYTVVGFGFFGAVCCVVGRVRNETLAMPELDDQLTQEIMHDIQQHQSDEERLADLIAEIDTEGDGT